MYADGKKVAVWAKKAVAAAVESGLVQGSKNGVNLTSEITRAESAVTVQRLLEKAELIGSTK
ncbi:hypothetical protein PghCCS26_09210 [Paenibacillus glycanilyticus]|uniref:SLH domain-containing protein n=1 Tax=Paenibacillus glycanilyticus TaxID=126569 RepID=A0ABQ6NG90_9BACL|nr:S-layer homology domain-containing protein [Paenibacillus glycanilyticus]GMK43794.1 hypothetical protein PghCCS26_09210 [Paenibacillus glycanilyticus]